MATSIDVANVQNVLIIFEKNAFFYVLLNIIFSERELFNLPSKIQQNYRTTNIDVANVQNVFIIFEKNAFFYVLLNIIFSERELFNLPSFLTNILSLA